MEEEEETVEVLEEEEDSEEEAVEEEVAPVEDQVADQEVSTRTNGPHSPSSED